VKGKGGLCFCIEYRAHAPHKTAIATRNASLHDDVVQGFVLDVRARYCPDAHNETSEAVTWPWKRVKPRMSILIKGD
jgi:hypothetical protein